MPDHVWLVIWAGCLTLFAGVFGAIAGAMTWWLGQRSGTALGKKAANALARVADTDFSPPATGLIVGGTARRSNLLAPAAFPPADSASGRGLADRLDGVEDALVLHHSRFARGPVRFPAVSEQALENRSRVVLHRQRLRLIPP